MRLSARADLPPGPALSVDHSIRRLDKRSDRRNVLGGDPIDVPDEHEEERQEQDGQDPPSPRLAAVGSLRPAQHHAHHM